MASSRHKALPQDSPGSRAAHLGTAPSSRTAEEPPGPAGTRPRCLGVTGGPGSRWGSTLRPSVNEETQPLRTRLFPISFPPLGCFGFFFLASCIHLRYNLPQQSNTFTLPWLQRRFPLSQATAFPGLHKTHTSFSVPTIPREQEWKRSDTIRNHYHYR